LKNAWPECAGVRCQAEIVGRFSPRRTALKCFLENRATASAGRADKSAVAPEAACRLHARRPRRCQRRTHARSKSGRSRAEKVNHPRFGIAFFP